jgi:putative two-component system response regulator
MSHDNRQTAGSLGNILILDDQSCVRGLLARWLTAAGYQCAEARDGAEAWDLLARQDFQLITIDIRLPGESGLDLVHQLKREYPQLAILMVTGVEVAIEAVQALTRGAFGYLIKPIDRDALLFHVRAGLEERQRKLDERNYLRWLEQNVADSQALPACAQTPRMPAHAHCNLREARWSAN